MNQRLLQFLQAENLSQSQFADTLQIARASVSNIITGRNKPGFEFLENLAQRFPSLNLEWFITGKGKMYKAEFAPVLDFPEEISPSQADIPGHGKVVKVIIFFEDNTFQEIIS